MESYLFLTAQPLETWSRSIVRDTMRKLLSLAAVIVGLISVAASLSACSEIHPASNAEAWAAGGANEDRPGPR